MMCVEHWDWRNNNPVIIKTWGNSENPPTEKHLISSACCALLLLDIDPIKFKEKGLESRIGRVEMPPSWTSNFESAYKDFLEIITPERSLNLSELITLADENSIQIHNDLRSMMHPIQVPAANVRATAARTAILSNQPPNHNLFEINDYKQIVYDMLSDKDTELNDHITTMARCRRSSHSTLAEYFLKLCSGYAESSSKGFFRTIGAWRRELKNTKAHTAIESLPWDFDIDVEFEGQCDPYSSMPLPTSNKIALENPDYTPVQLDWPQDIPASPSPPMRLRSNRY